MNTLLLALHFIVCFVLIAVVLLQRGKGSDIGASLGGGGANTVFGSRGAGNFLTKLTTASAIIFMCTSLSLAYLGTQESGGQLFDDATVEEAALPDLEPIAEPDAAAAEADGLTEVEDPGALEEIPQPAIPE